MGTSKNWFATEKLSEAEPEQARKVANNDVIRHFEQRTMAMCHSQICRKGIFRCALMRNCLYLGNYVRRRKNILTCI